METEIGCSYVADVTGALEKLRQGTVDESRQRNRNRKEVEDNRTRRSLSPGLCRSYDWNTTHFYPDIHEESELNDLIPTYQGMGRTVRFASDRESDEEKEEGNDEELEEEEEEEMEGKGVEEWRRGQRNGEEDCMGESKKYVSSSDDFDEWNSENENDSYRNAIRGSGLKVKASPIVQDRQGMRNGNGVSLTEEGQTCPSADLANFGVGQTGREEMDRSGIRIEPRQSVLLYDETELDDWKNNVDDSEWRWEKGRTEHQPTNAPCENEDERPCNDWNQWKFIDEETYPSIPSKKSSTQFCNNGKPDCQTLKSRDSDDSDDLQKTKKAALTRVLAKEDDRKDDRPSRIRGRYRPGQKSKSHEKGIGLCMVTHFDDPWPVSDFGSDYTERRKEQPTFKSHDAPPIPTKEQHSTEGKSLRSILKQNKVADVPTNNNIIDPFGGSVLPQMEPSQSSTLPNLHRFAESTASCSASVVDDKGEVQTHEMWKETGDNDAQDKRWKSESFLFLEDATRSQQSRNGKRKRFVIDYRRPSRGHVTFTGSGERRTIGPFTLNEFELCLEIPAGQQLHVKDVSPAMKDEENGSRKMEEIPMELPVNRCRIGETGKDDLSVGSDPSSDLLWLFHSLSRNDFPTWKGSRNPCTEYQPQTRSATTIAPFHAATLGNAVHTKETLPYPDNNQKADVKWKTGDVMRQQYRWSTAIREPQARILLDHWDVDPPLRPIPPPTNRYRIVRPGQDLPTKYHTTDIDSVRPNESASSQNERAFTIAGQPKSSSSFQKHSSAGQPTTNFALVGFSHQDGHTVPQLGGFSKDWQNERTSVRLDDTVEPFLTNQKHRYLRERVLTEDFYPELIDPTPADPILSRSYSDYQGLQKLEQLRLAAGGAKRTPICHETWDSDSSRSLLSLPSNLPRQRNVDMSSGGSQDSVGSTSEARIPRGQRMLGRRGNVCAVVSPMLKPPTSQTQEESSRDRGVPTEMMNTVGGSGSTRFATSNEGVEKTPAAADDHRPNNFRTNKKTHQTPRTVKARHELKSRRVKGSD